MRVENFKEKYGPWALIAGASEGLGAAFAESAAENGLNLILIARREHILSSLADSLMKKYEVTVITASLDLGDLNKLRTFISGIREEIGLFIYNAAYAPINNFLNLSEDQIFHSVDVNIKAPLFLVKTIAGKMHSRGKGGIILMSSLSGFQGSPKISAYSASKSYNTVLAEGLWREMKEPNIDVLACCPGAVRTPGYSLVRNQKEAPGILNASEVVIEAFKSLGKRPVIIPGLLNKIFYFILGRLLSKKSAIEIMYRNTKEL